jgi:hypothetical protein
MEVAEEREGYPPFRPGDLVSPGLALAAVRPIGEGAVQPYLLAGAGGYRMRIEERHPDPYRIRRTIGALFAGGGLEREMGSWRLFAETRAKVTLSDYGSREFSPGVQLPTTVGVGRRVGRVDPARCDWIDPDRISSPGRPTTPAISRCPRAAGSEPERSTPPLPGSGTR